MRAMGRVLCMLCVIALLCAIAPASRAEAVEPEAKARVAMLPLAFGGDIEPPDRHWIQQRWIQSLCRSSVSCVEPDAVRGAHAQAETCADAECYMAVTGAVDATHVLRVSIDLRARDYAIQVEIADGRRGEVLATTEDTCEICGRQELADMIDAMAGSVLRRLEAIDVSAAVVVVESSPPGATVLVDGEIVGVTPFEGAVPLGTHRMRVEKPGYVTRKHELVAVAGMHERISVDLQAVPEREDRLRPWGWPLFGVGIATVATGVALLVIDERPIERKCNGDNVDADGDCRLLYDTMAGGIAATVAGGVLTAVGVALVVVAKRRKKQGRARAMLGPSGAALEVRF
jgi:hypothetical protein